MGFPTPPPVRTPPRRPSPVRLDSKLVRLLYLVSAVLWIVVFSGIGAIVTWFVAWPSIKGLEYATAIGVLLNLLFAIVGYIFGTSVASQILIEAAQKAKARAHLTAV